MAFKPLPLKLNYVDAWSSRVRIAFQRIEGANAPIPTGAVSTQIKMDCVDFRVESRSAGWTIRQREGIILNAEGDPFLREGMTPININDHNSDHPALLNAWRIVLGYDFRGLGGRAEVAPADFGLHAAAWLKNPKEAFSFYTLLTQARAAYRLPFGDEGLFVGGAKFWFVHRRRSNILATLDQRPAFDRIELSAYDPRTKRPISKWFFDKDSGQFYETLEDGSQVYCVGLPGERYFDLHGYRFVPNNNFQPGRSIFRLRFLDDKLVDGFGHNNGRLAMTQGDPLSLEEPKPVIIGETAPGQPHPKLKGFFSVKFRPRSRSHPPYVQFCREAYYFGKKDLAALGLKEDEPAELTARVEAGRIAAFYPKGDLARGGRKRTLLRIKEELIPDWNRTIAELASLPELTRPQKFILRNIIRRANWFAKKLSAAERPHSLTGIMLRVKILLRAQQREVSDRTKKPAKTAQKDFPGKDPLWLPPDHHEMAAAASRLGGGEDREIFYNLSDAARRDLGR